MPSETLDEKAIFNVARQIDSPDARAEYLRQACGTDSGLRERIEVLLHAYEEQASFLESPPPVGIAPTIDLPATESPGTVFGPYKLVEQIGEGGMGTVWMAQQTEPVKRLVAVKLIKAGMDSKQVVARFEAERQALALMDHPNIARVLDAGTTDTGRPYFVMDLVKGVPITRYCDEHRLTPRQRLELFIPVCQAVQHAHQKGVIHRDLKSTNVLVALYDDKPVPKVIDFGVAKAAGHTLTDKTLVTGFGAIVGTPEYMSPEQAEVNQLDIDTRSDIYSLGVLLYELLTGTPPFSRKELEKAGMLEMLRVIREQEPSRPSTKLSTADGLPTLAANRGTEPAKLTRLVKGELDWIVMKALEKDRNRRYETANGFAMDVQRYLAGEAVQAHPPSTTYRLRKYVRRNKGPVLAACLVVLALAGGVVGATWGMVRASAAKAVAISEAEQKEAALREAQDRLWWSLYDRARAGRFSRQAGQRLDSLAAVAQAARIRPDERLRDEAIAAMALPDVRRVPAGPPLPVGGVAAYGGSRRICARADAQGRISIRRVADDREILQIAAGPLGRGCCLYFSPDERYLLGLGEGFALRVWRVDDGQPALRDEPRPCWAHSFSSDGRRLAVSQSDQILVFDLLTGSEVTRWRLPGGRVNALAIHPDNTRLAVGHTRSAVASVYDLASGALVTDLPVGAMGAQVVAWHPDGQRLAVGGSDPRIQIWNVPAKRRVATLEGHIQNVTAVPFHPDRDLLASHSWDGVLRLWECATGRPLLQVPLAVVGRPRFGVDGRWPAAGLHGDQAELLEVVPSREYRTLVSSAGAGRGGYRHYADISPDGSLLAVGMDDGARLWDLAGGREVAALPAGTIFAFFDALPVGDKEGALLTAGAGGLCRWPLARGDTGLHPLRLGKPRQLSEMGRAWFARGADGRAWGVATEEGGPNHVVDLETGAVRRELGVHPNGEVMALSPNGRWAASSGWHSDLVRLWNARTGEVVREWVVGQKTYVFFTPDSRALIISRGDEYSFHDVESLQLIRRLPRDTPQFPGHVAFSPDGRLMALEMAPGVMHLKEASTGRSVARLTDPHGDRASWQGFTPDGTKLVVVSRNATAIHIWDLRALRERLKEMNLDWDWPEFPQPPPAPVLTAPAPFSGEAEGLNGTPSPKELAEARSAVSRRAIDSADRGHPADALRLIEELLTGNRRAGDLRTDGGTVAKCVQHFRRRGDLSACRAATEVLERRSPADQGTLYDTACCRALTAAAQAEAGGPDAERLAKEEADRAMDWLTRAVAAGYANFTHIEVDADLDSLREREDFRKLVADLLARARPIEMARYHTRRSRWDEAAAEYAKADLWSRPLPEDAYAHAGVLLLRGDAAGYDSFCRNRIKRAGLTATPWEGYVLARMCAAAPQAPADPAQAVKWAEKAVADERRPWYVHVLGLAQYRAGEFNRALQSFTAAQVKEWAAADLNWIGLALVHHRLGQADEARRCLDKGVQWLEREGPPGPGRPAKMHTADWVEAQLLRREAEQLIGPGPKEKPNEK